jgi:hypothetical protein
MSFSSSVLPIFSQPHWDARHTIAGKNAETGPRGFVVMIQSMSENNGAS